MSLFIEHLVYTALAVIICAAAVKWYAGKAYRKWFYAFLIAALAAQFIDIDHIDGQPILAARCAAIISYSDPLLQTCNIVLQRGIFHSFIAFFFISLALTFATMMVSEKHMPYSMGFIFGYALHIICDNIIRF